MMAVAIGVLALGLVGLTASLLVARDPTDEEAPAPS